MTIEQIHVHVVEELRKMKIEILSQRGFIENGDHVLVNVDLILQGACIKFVSINSLI